MPRDTTPRFNPLLGLVSKQRVPQEDADSIALMVLCWLDAAKRGQCNAPGHRFLTTHLIIGSYVASRTRSQRFHEVITAAYNMLRKASERPTELLALTTTEYAALRTGFSWYLRSLPMVEIGMMNAACGHAQRVMEGA